MDGQNLLHWQERIDLAAAFRWAARLNMHEAVANHFSLSVNEDGTQFLMNPQSKTILVVSKHLTCCCWMQMIQKP